MSVTPISFLFSHRLPVRFAAALAAGLLAASASAQVTVSNLANDIGSSATISTSANTPVAVSFTTDSATYSLTSVTLSLGGVNTSSPLMVSIYNDNSGQPGSSLTALSGASPTSTGNYTFTSTGLALSANTTYWVAAATSGSGEYYWNLTTDLSQSNTGGATWTIGDDTQLFNSGSWNTISVSAFMSVTATAVPEPGTYAALAGLTALGFVAWRRRRAAA
jgi:hypothetical protein